MSNTLEVLRRIIADKYEKDPALITLESTLESLELDSLDIFDLLFNAEDEFGIKVPNDQVEITTLADLVALIDRVREQQGRA